MTDVGKETVNAYIGLGSNLGDRERTLEDAAAELGDLPDTLVTARSSWLENPAVGIEGGHDFLNGVVEIETGLSPRELLGRLFEIEERHGRKRSGEGQGYRNRTLDLDLLLYGEERIEEPGLVVPHPRMLERSFVVDPLKELGVILDDSNG